MYPIENGRTHPLGANLDANGCNFSVWSEFATGVELLPSNTTTAGPVPGHQAQPQFNRRSVLASTCAGSGRNFLYRVDGPWDRGGNRFNRNKVIIDPYARATNSALWQRGDACGPDDNVHTSQRAVVVDESYDWEGDEPLNRRMSETIIYEMHVGGYTESPTSGVAHPGTFAGVIEKIPYLKDLGITAVEVLPVFDFDPTEIDKPNPAGGPNLSNYWGYSTVSFFAPHSRCVSRARGAPASSATWSRRSTRPESR
jgi:glycogen operon protein